MDYVAYDRGSEDLLVVVSGITFEYLLVSELRTIPPMYKSLDHSVQYIIRFLPYSVSFFVVCSIFIYRLDCYHFYSLHVETEDCFVVIVVSSNVPATCSRQNYWSLLDCGTV